MATASLGELNEIFVCPVCYENYTDPRILSCAHQFCLRCLEQVVLKKPPQQDKITCPTCRQETLIKPGKQVSDLPRHVLMNELQGLLANRFVSQSQTGQSNQRQCDLCESLDVAATSYCYQCHQKMCEACGAEHSDMGTFDGHVTVEITDSLFCLAHDNVVTSFCHACRLGICTRCAVKDHRKHKTENIHAMTGQSREKISEFLAAQESVSLSPAIVRNVKAKVRELEKSQESIVCQIDIVIDVLKSFEAQLEHSRNEVLAKTSRDIDSLKLYEERVANFKASKASLSELGRHLLEKASDPELVLKAQQFPSASSVNAMEQLPAVRVNDAQFLVKLQSKLSRLKNLCHLKCNYDFSAEEAEDLPNNDLPYNLQTGAITSQRVEWSNDNVTEEVDANEASCSTSGAGSLEWARGQEAEAGEAGEPFVEEDGASPCQHAPEEETFDGPINDLTFKRSINVRGRIHDVTFFPKLSLLAIRTSENSAPLQIFDLDGSLVHYFGRTILELSTDKGLSIDPKRDLYLAPCGGHLTTIDVEGEACEDIQVKGRSVDGVAYCSDTDQYIVTEISERAHRVIVIDADSKKLVRSFGSEGTGDDQFNNPFHVCVGEIEGRATIVVSDNCNHAVKLFDLRGRHLKTYGSEGDGEGQLRFPRGVAVDPAGRVIVCDFDNQRVVAFWSEGDEDHWKCLLPASHLRESPLAIDIDLSNNIMAIHVGDHTIRLYTLG